MENLFHRSGFEVPETVRRFLQGDAEAWLRIEQYRDGNTLVIRTDLPGIDPEQDVDITVTGDTLQIDARREEPGYKDQAGYRSELRYGEFSRSIPLPRGAYPDEIEATYRDGVLEVRVRLPEQSGTSATKVKVSRGGNQSPEAPESYT
jgi:HSP20 family protein